MRVALIALAIIIWSAPAFAQNAGPTSKLGWTQAAPTLAVAGGYAYVWRDSGVMGTTLSGVTCTGTASPFACAAAMPSTLKPGAHVLTLVAIDTSTLTPLESAESAPLSFEFRAVPTPPQNFRLVP